jgi:hypothetical protein
MRSRRICRVAPPRVTARALPWRRPRHEVLALALVAVVACSVVQRINVQDESRTCQIRAFVHARLTIGDCIGQTLDRSRYHGLLYSNKAPGMALLVTLSLGTLMSTLAVTNFDHVPAAAIGLAAFVLLWGRSPLAADLTGGLALLVEYEAAAIVVALARMPRGSAGTRSRAMRSAPYRVSSFSAPTTGPRSERRGTTHSAIATTSIAPSTRRGCSASRRRAP